MAPQKLTYGMNRPHHHELLRVSHQSIHSTNSRSSTVSVGNNKTNDKSAILSSIAPSKRSVTFAPRIRCKRTLQVSEYTPEECSASWYNAEEISSARAAVKRTIEKMNRHETLSDEECSRGLEHRVSAALVQRRSTIDYARHVVLSEQDECRCPTEYDDLIIAKRYSTVSRQSESAAYRMGRLDQRAAYGN